MIDSFANNTEMLRLIHRSGLPRMVYVNIFRVDAFRELNHYWSWSSCSVSKFCVHGTVGSNTLHGELEHDYTR